MPGVVRGVGVVSGCPWVAHQTLVSAQAGIKVVPALVTFVTAAWNPPPPELHQEQGLDAAQEGFPHPLSPLPTA